jgi:hypothetical protein
MKDERVKAARRSKALALPSRRRRMPRQKKALIADIMNALYASKIVSYAQGYMLLRAAAKEIGWSLNYGGIALMWRGGCIIRSRFLGKIKEAYDNNPKLTNLLLDGYFRGEIKRCQKAWRNVVSLAVEERASPSRPSERRSRSSTATGTPVCRRTSCRPSATTSERTLTNASTNPGASFSIPTGRDRRSGQLQHLQRLIRPS